MYVIYYERTSACISKNCHSCQKQKQEKETKQKKNNQKQFHKVAFKWIDNKCVRLCELIAIYGSVPATNSAMIMIIPQLQTRQPHKA